MERRGYASAAVVDGQGRVVARTSGADGLVDDGAAERLPLPGGGMLLASPGVPDAPWQRLARAFVHEARSPLNALAIYLELLGARAAGAPGSSRPEAAPERVLQRANDQIRRLDQLFTEFVALWAPRAEEGTDLARIGRAAGRFAQHEALRRTLKLEIDACDRAPVAADGARLADGLVALLGCVIAGAAPETELRLTVRAHEREADVELRRTAGPPLEPSILTEGARALTLAGATVSLSADSLVARLPLSEVPAGPTTNR